MERNKKVFEATYKSVLAIYSLAHIYMFKSTCTQCAHMILSCDYMHMMHVCTVSAVSLFNRVLREREISGREGERQCMSVKTRLHDTYFYACSFAPAYGWARATRIDGAWSALCHIYKS